MSLSDEIRVKVDEAERRLEASTDASPLPWASTDSGFVIDGNGSGVCDDILRVDRDLVVSVVNRERAQIEHARDVLERHIPVEDHDHRPEAPDLYCPADEQKWPCPEILSLGRAWGVSDGR